MAQIVWFMCSASTVLQPKALRRSRRTDCGYVADEGGLRSGSDLAAVRGRA